MLPPPSPSVSLHGGSTVQPPPAESPSLRSVNRMALVDPSPQSAGSYVPGLPHTHTHTNTSGLPPVASSASLRSVAIGGTATNGNTKSGTVHSSTSNRLPTARHEQISNGAAVTNTAVSVNGVSDIPAASGTDQSVPVPAPVKCLCSCLQCCGSTAGVVLGFSLFLQFACTLAYIVVETLLPPVIDYDYNFSVLDNGIIWTCAAGVGVVSYVTLQILSRVGRWYSLSDSTLLLNGVCWFCLGVFCLSAFPWDETNSGVSGWLLERNVIHLPQYRLAIGLVLVVVGFTHSDAVSLSIYSKWIEVAAAESAAASPDSHGKSMGNLMSVQALACMVGPVVGTQSYAVLDRNIFLLLAVLLLASIVLTVIVWRPIHSRDLNLAARAAVEHHQNQTSHTATLAVPTTSTAAAPPHESAGIAVPSRSLDVSRDSGAVSGVEPPAPPAQQQQPVIGAGQRTPKRNSSRATGSVGSVIAMGSPSPTKGRATGEAAGRYAPLPPAPASPHHHHHTSSAVAAPATPNQHLQPPTAGGVSLSPATPELPSPVSIDNPSPAVGIVRPIPRAAPTHAEDEAPLPAPSPVEELNVRLLP